MVATNLDRYTVVMIIDKHIIQSDYTEMSDCRSYTLYWLLIGILGIGMYVVS